MENSKWKTFNFEKVKVKIQCITVVGKQKLIEKIFSVNIEKKQLIFTT